MTPAAAPEPSGDHLQSKLSQAKKPFLWILFKINRNGGKEKGGRTERISTNRFVTARVSSKKKKLTVVGKRQDRSCDVIIYINFHFGFVFPPILLCTNYKVPFCFGCGCIRRVTSSISRPSLAISRRAGAPAVGGSSSSLDGGSSLNSLTASHVFLPA